MKRALASMVKEALSRELHAALDKAEAMREAREWYLNLFNSGIRVNLGAIEKRLHAKMREALTKHLGKPQKETPKNPR